MLMFSLLLNPVKAFSVPYAAPPMSGLGVGRKLGGDTAGTADPSQPKGCPILYDVVLSSKSWGKGGGRGDMRRDGVCLPKSP